MGSICDPAEAVEPAQNQNPKGKPISHPNSDPVMELMKAQVTEIGKEQVPMSELIAKFKAIIIVNVASQWKYTDRHYRQYK